MIRWSGGWLGLGHPGIDADRSHHGVFDVVVIVVLIRERMEWLVRPVNRLSPQI